MKSKREISNKTPHITPLFNRLVLKDIRLLLSFVDSWNNLMLSTNFTKFYYTPFCKHPSNYFSGNTPTIVQIGRLPQRDSQ